MIDTSVTPKADIRRPFLPSNFYEARTSTTLAPKEFARNNVPAPTTPQALPKLVKIRTRRFLRTFTTLFHEDGRLSNAKINLSTGELLKWNYKDHYVQRPAPRSDSGTCGSTPFWVDMPPPALATKATTTKDSSYCKRINPVKIYLEGYLCLKDAAVDLPQLRGAIESASLFDLGGNTRPLASGMLFGMLQHLDVITPLTVIQYMGCGLRHAQKVAGCLRVIVNAFEKSADGKLSTAVHKNAT